MRDKSGFAWFSAFTAVFAVLALFVFWGTWSTEAAPVMPDCSVWHPVDWLAARWKAWLADGKFVPDDVLRLIGGPYVWQELQYAFAAGCSGLGLAYFLRGRGLHRLAAYGAGLLLAFSGYWFSLFSAGHLGWFRWMTYGVFAFGLVDRCVEEGWLRHWALLGACLAWGSMHQPDLWLLFTVFTAVYFVYRTIVTYKRGKDIDVFRWIAFHANKHEWLVGWGVALAAFLVIGLVSFRSAIVNDLSGRDRQISESASAGDAKDAAEKRWEFVTNWSMPPEDTLEFFCPRVHGDTSCQMVLSLGRSQNTGVTPYTGRLGRPLNAPEDKVVNYRQHSLYVGWITCLLALVGIAAAFARPQADEGVPAACRDRRGTILFFLVAGVLFYLFSLGRYCEPVYRLIYALPMGDYLRAPVKWHHLTEFCLAVLAGFGIDFLLRRFGETRRWVAPALAALVVIGAIDLARIDRLYCSAIDLTVVRAKNPAAEAVLKEPGKVLDLVERGQGLVAWSFAARGVEMTGSQLEMVKYIWAPSEILRNPTFDTWLKDRRVQRIGTYRVSNTGIYRAESGGGNAILIAFPEPASPPPPPPPVDRTTRALALLSFVGTLSVGAWGVWGGLRR